MLLHASSLDELEQLVLTEMEKIIVARTEEIEGHIPSNQEVQTHGQRIHYTSQVTGVTWRGQLIAYCSAPHKLSATEYGVVVCAVTEPLRIGA